MERIAVIGAGAFGTALAVAGQRAGREVVLWARRAELAAALQRDRENVDYLPGVNLDPAIGVTNDLAEAADCEALLLVVPAQTLRALAGELARRDLPPRPLVICAKGIEQSSGGLMSEVLSEVLPGWPLAVLSGPTFAAELARGLPSATTLAVADAALGRRLVAALGSRSFRPYLSDDLVGAQIGGAVKNIIAIACGIVTGLRLGANARAALITRGLAEIVRLGQAKGARARTLMGLSGLGDLTLTCTDDQSRNYSLGRLLGEGQSLDDVLAGRRSVSEGVHSAVAVSALAEHLGVEMPISAAVHAVLHQGAGVVETVEALLARPFREESH